MAEVWFIRHGESTSNAGEVTSDTSIVELTELGHKQARAVSLVLPKAPDLIVATPYLRTQQTALPTRECFPSARYETWALQEFSPLSHAAYANKNANQRAPFVKAYSDRQDPDYVDGPGAESFSTMVSRIKDAFQRLQDSPEDFIVIFTHGRIMHTMRFLLERPELSEKELMTAIPDYAARTGIENCSIIRATADAQGIRLHENDRKVFEAGFAIRKAPVKRNPRFSPGNY